MTLWSPGAFQNLFRFDTDEHTFFVIELATCLLWVGHFEKIKFCNPDASRLLYGVALEYSCKQQLSWKFHILERVNIYMVFTYLIYQ